MSILNWLLSGLASDDVIDRDFILSDLEDLPYTKSARALDNQLNSAASAHGYTVENNHVYDADGNDLGPAGRFVG